MDYNLILNDSEKLKVLSRLVTHLMGDGCVTNKYFAYFNKNEDLLKNYEKDLLKLFSEVHIIRGISNSGTSLIQVQNKEIIYFLKSLLKDYRSKTLEIPKFINTKDLRKELLQSIYDDEGCVGLRVYRKTNELKRDITLSSNSLKFIEQIKEILIQDFNISSNKIAKNVKIVGSKIFTNYILPINGKSNFEKFQKEIDFAHPTKKEKLEKMIKSYIRLAGTK
ncbi:MAG: LAGLIDADG family homing endonuclease [Nanoarchaeota archaeon]|mgnify:CR=1 FL=1